MYRSIRSEECVYRFIVRNYLLSLPPRRVEEGRYDVSMSCTEGVTKRRYRVLCSWWPLVPDNTLLLYSIFNEVELRTYYAKVVGSDRVASRRVRVRGVCGRCGGCGARERTRERANVRTCERDARGPSYAAYSGPTFHWPYSLTVSTGPGRRLH